MAIMNLVRLHPTGFGFAPHSQIRVHWPQATSEFTFAANTDLNLGTAQPHPIPYVAPGTTADDSNSIRVVVEATGETYHLCDRTAGGGTPTVRNPNGGEAAIPVAPQTNWNAGLLTLTYAGGGGAQVTFGLS